MFPAKFIDAFEFSISNVDNEILSKGVNKSQRKLNPISLSPLPHRLG